MRSWVSRLFGLVSIQMAHSAIRPRIHQRMRIGARWGGAAGLGGSGTARGAALWLGGGTGGAGGGAGGTATWGAACGWAGEGLSNATVLAAAAGAGWTGARAPSRCDTPQYGQKFTLRGSRRPHWAWMHR